MTQQAEPKTGPLSGLTVLEMAGIGPVPLAGLMLSEMGADVLRIERAGPERPFLVAPPEFDLDRHGRSIVKIDLKQPDGAELVLKMMETADILIEGYRPGVMERLGIGPDAALLRNPGLVYGRMTGFGQHGPLSARAGHDLTYLAYSGMLHAIGPKDGKPVPPLNLVADFGGGTMFLITGILAALVEKSRSGKGQVIDAAMVEGASMLGAPYFGFMASGFWQDKRASNLLDSGSPFYDTYDTSDGKFVAVACLEPQFFAEFARRLPLEKDLADSQYDRSKWDPMRDAIAARFILKTRDQWTEIFENSDACVAPVLSLKEAPVHAHNRARHSHATTGHLERPAPAPRFSRTPSQISTPALPQNLARALERFGISIVETERLASLGVVSP